MQELAGVLPGQLVLVKDETRTESGSHKHRAAAAVVRAARAAGHDWLTVGSCGNYGLAVAAEAAACAAAVDVVLPAAYASGAMADRLRQLGAELHHVPGGYEDAVAASRALTTSRRDGQEHGKEDGGPVDANVDGPFAAQVAAALATIAVEIAVAMPAAAPPGTSAPDLDRVTVWVPTGNGTTVAAVADPAAGLPRRAGVVAVTATGSNSVLASWPTTRHTPLDPAHIVSTPAREPLVNWAALHGQEALDALHARRAAGGSGHVVGVTDADLHDARAVLSDHGIPASPAGAAGLAGLLAHPAGAADAVHVVVVTGR
ncbi:MAG: pyridoxal-phosphate dependent enzyme [Kineosporiaceae bacterium]